MVVLEADLKKYGTKSCIIDNIIKILGRKFTLHILRNMILLKQKHFVEFLDSIQGINSKTLFYSIERDGEGRYD